MPLKIRPGGLKWLIGGTLFLDEIGNLEQQLQTKLLSAIQNRKICRVGSSQEIPVDIRLVCATNLDLNELVESGTFREDLLYRINTIQIIVPPLRKRKEDIEILVAHFFEFLQIEIPASGTKNEPCSSGNLPES